jgi:hypothetical protein
MPEAKARMLKNLAFKIGSRTLMLEDVDLSTTFGKLRERLVREKDLENRDIYFVFGGKPLDDSKFLRVRSELAWALTPA